MCTAMCTFSRDRCAIRLHARALQGDPGTTRFFISLQDRPGSWEIRSRDDVASATLQHLHLRDAGFAWWLAVDWISGALALTVPSIGTVRTMSSESLVATRSKP